MEHLKFLIKTNVKDGDKVVYFYYNLPDTSNYSNFQTQAKPLIEELKEAMPLIKTQIVGLHEKIVKIINDDSTIINGLKQQLEQYKQSQQKVDDQVTELQANKEKVQLLNLKEIQVLYKKMGNIKIIIMGQNQLPKLLQLSLI